MQNTNNQSNNRYEEAFEQYQKETGFSKKDFDKNIKEFGDDYISYYQKRYKKEELNQNRIIF